MNHVAMNSKIKKSFKIYGFVSEKVIKIGSETLYMLFHVGDLENLENPANVTKKICSAANRMIIYVIFILQSSRS